MLAAAGGEVGFSRVTGITPHAQRVLLRAMAYANPERKTLAGIAHIWQELLYEEGCTALLALEALGRNVESMRTALANTAGEIERPIRARQIAASAEPITQQEAAAMQPSAPRTSSKEKKESALGNAICPESDRRSGSKRAGTAYRTRDRNRLHDPSAGQKDQE